MTDTAQSGAGYTGKDNTMKRTLKKFVAIALTLALTLTLAACGTANVDGDLAAVKDKGTLVVGITEYEPMDYLDENGEWTGFDAEFARAFADELGVEAEFVVIDWGQKFYELESGAIDCVWNGMTITDEALANASVGNPYVVNAQVVVMDESKLADYPDTESLKSLTFAVESSSAGQAALDAVGITNYVEVLEQSDALMEVGAGSVDACVIDITMADATTADGASYAELGYTVSLTSEEYGVAFRKDSNMTAAFNEFMADMLADGTLQALAKKYNLTLAK